MTDLSGYAKKSTANAHLTALDHFFSQLGLGPAVVRRDDAPKLAPRALDAPSRSGTCAPSNDAPSPATAPSAGCSCTDAD
ncbi:hypothetical protein ACFU93_45410 [Streptomyces sp. NPDC057611]|uniref:hypothetical protein n=1 Tax=Streptomyces sp. NPDC057611 TaxID=3346182 RepID=UPI00369A7CCA